MSEELRLAFATLNDFRADQWATWILRFLNDAADDPFVSRGLDPPHLALNSIFDQMSPTARSEFAAGFSKLVPQIRPDPSTAGLRQSFGLLKVADHVSPWQAQAALFSRLTSGCMRGLRYGGWELHSLLLVACCHFGIDQRLEDYIFRSIILFNDFDYGIVAFRQLLKLGGTRALLLLEHFLAGLRVPHNVERLAVVLREAIDLRSGSWPLLHWLQESAPRLRAEGVRGIDEFETILQSIVKWQPNADRSEPGLLLVSAWIHAPVRYFNASDLVSLASSVHRLEHDDRTERENRAEILRRVLERILHYGQPWDCIDGQDQDSPWNRIGIGKVFRIVSHASDGGTDELDVPQSEFLRGFKILREVVLLADTDSGTRKPARHRTAVAKALAARSI
jgi:hypothetical protein